MDLHARRRVATGLAAVAVLASAAAALAQPARVSFVVTRPGTGREIGLTNDALGAPATRLLARCVGAARAARPLDEQYFTLDVGTDGRVLLVHAPAVPPRFLDLATRAVRTPTPAEAARAAAWIACAGRALRRLRLPVGPAGPVEVVVAWHAPGPSEGVVGMLRPP
jgi:hypothetical protein